MLATDPQDLRDHYDVLIIGSGYGGAITAARLGYANAQAGKKLKIGILERGVEHPTGSLPVTAGQFAGKLLTPQQPLGLFQFVLGPDIYCVQGSSLGGTSLVNGGVCIIPDREVFDAYWPRAIAYEEPFPLERYYKRALAMLDAVPYAQDENLDKAAIFEQISEAVGGQFGYLNLAVTKKDRTTRYGVPRRACVNCTSCISGCNYEAKNTLDKNYLPMAKHYGVDMFTAMEVRFFQQAPDGEGWEVSAYHRTGPNGSTKTMRNIRARRLVVSAGCLGTAGIMLRSQSRALRFSQQLGKKFSGNGDFFTLSYNMDKVANMNGWGVGVPKKFQVKGGPTITTFFKMNNGQPLEERLTFEEASMPAPFVDIMRNGAFLSAAGQPWKFLNTPAKLKRWYEDRYRNNTGAMNSSLLYLGMGFDGAGGTIRLKGDGNVTVDWPGAQDVEVFRLLEKATEKGTAALGGDLIPNPIMEFNLPIRRKAMTGHPIGGCATAETVDDGVVDPAGRVFRPDGGVYDGLYVFDGSILPNAIGVNVLLTISAFTERAVEHLRKEMSLPGFDEEQELNDYA